MRDTKKRKAPPPEPPWHKPHGECVTHEDRVMHRLHKLHEQGELIMANLSALNDAVTANTAAVNAAVAAGIGSNPATDAAVDAATATISANTASLTAATPSV